MPDNSINDIGANLVSSARAVRIDEMISQIIREGRKVTYADMSAIQQDDTDVFAR